MTTSARSNLPVQTYTTTALKRIGMASESGSIDFSDLLPEFTAADWYPDLYTLRPFNLDLFAFEETSLFQNVFESTLPSLPPHSTTGEFTPTFIFDMLMDVLPVQAVKQNTLPSHPNAPRSPCIQPQATAMPPANGARNLHVTGGKRSPTSVVVPAAPPPVLSLPLNTTFPIDWIRIPQRRYDHGRKQRNFKPLEPISFSTNGRPGINLGDALRKRFTGLDGRDDPMLPVPARAISCRLLFPGYPDCGQSSQVHALNWTRNPLPIPRSKLAHEFAKKIEQYLNRMARITPDESIEDRWRIGTGFMHIDNMFLVNLVSVSKSSFQPEIWVADPSVPHVRGTGRR